MTIEMWDRIFKMLMDEERERENDEGMERDYEKSRVTFWMNNGTKVYGTWGSAVIDDEGLIHIDSEPQVFIPVENVSHVVMNSVWVKVK